MGGCEGSVRPRRACPGIAGMVVLLLGIADGSVAATFHVPGDAPSIQAGIDAAAHGDTVVVAVGTYTEHIDFHGKAIAVVAADGPAATIIDGGRAGPVVRFSSGETPNTELRGFTVRNGYGLNEGAGIYVFQSSPTIVGNIVTANEGCNGSGIYVRFGSPIIRGNTITNNRRTACFGGGGGGGISLSGAGGAQVLDNDISYNVVLSGWAGGIEVFGAGTALIRGNVLRGNSTGGEGGAIVVVGPSKVTVANNLMVGNSAIQAGGGMSIQMFVGADNPIVVNNTIGENSSAVGSAMAIRGFNVAATIANNALVASRDQVAVSCNTGSQPATQVFRFNDVYSATADGYTGPCGDLTGMAGNVAVDPLFVDASTGDYHLTLASPLIDAGNNADARTLEDFEGDPRIVDGDALDAAVVDIGRDEVSPGVAPFATFVTKTCFTTPRAAPHRIVVRGTLALAASTYGISPTNEAVDVTLSDDAGVLFHHQMPTGSFVKIGGYERYSSRTSAGDAVIDVRLAATKPAGAFKLQMRVRGWPLDRLPAGDLRFVFRVGDDAGASRASCSVRATSARCPL